ncbi:TolC family protein [Rubritalea marina]|uniref:TolC family protein n=1 Tax=Rubritalea marina TaxID=361055 RepID=UPI000363A82E|nr:TolC family protein [Rubritalea marina]
MKALFYFTPTLFLTVSCSSQTTQFPIVPATPPAKKIAVERIGSIDNENVALTLSNLRSLVQRNNPNLAAARKLIDAAQGRLQKAGLRSNPTVEVEFETTANLREPFLIAGISRSFPRTNRLLLEKRVSAPLVEAARAEVANAERLLVGEAREQLVEVLALREVKGLLQEQSENAQELADFINEAAARGEASLLEVPTAEIEVTRIHTKAEQIQIQIDLAEAKLKPILGFNPEAKLAVAGALPPTSLPPMQVSVPRDRPDLVAAKLRAKSATENIHLTQAEGIPDYDLGVYAGLGREEDEPEGGELEGIIGVRFSMPLGRDPKTPGALREAHAERDRLDLTTLALRKSITAEVRAAYGEMAQWQKLAVRINQDLIPKARENLFQIRTAYQDGQVPLQDVLRAREQELSLKLTLIEARQNFHKARSRYLTATNG